MFTLKKSLLLFFFLLGPSPYLSVRKREVPMKRKRTL
ncbi:unnamed protein product [Staurois parvus]|uniref:Uncharacterized protein n=1 Tax=Staurois parvus TaxID=386267 RepID=A0ABN9B1W4_9NEOB|nr:unnamed protein product [Staurois parvus]